MKDIKDLLSNIGNILLSEELKKGSIIDSIFQVTNLEISSKDIKIKNSVIYLNIKPIYKNEIFINKEKILFFLENSLGRKKYLDIK